MSLLLVLVSLLALPAARAIITLDKTNAQSGEIITFTGDLESGSCWSGGYGLRFFLRDGGESYHLGWPGINPTTIIDPVNWPNGDNYFVNGTINTTGLASGKYAIVTDVIYNCYADGPGMPVNWFRDYIDSAEFTVGDYTDTWNDGTVTLPVNAIGTFTKIFNTGNVSMIDIYFRTDDLAHVGYEKYYSFYPTGWWGTYNYDTWYNNKPTDNIASCSINGITIFDNTANLGIKEGRGAVSRFLTDGNNTVSCSVGKSKYEYYIPCNGYYCYPRFYSTNYFNGIIITHSKNIIKWTTNAGANWQNIDYDDSSWFWNFKPIEDAIQFFSSPNYWLYDGYNYYVNQGQRPYNGHDTWFRTFIWSNESKTQTLKISDTKLPACYLNGQLLNLRSYNSDYWRYSTDVNLSVGQNLLACSSAALPTYNSFDYELTVPNGQLAITNVEQLTPAIIGQPVVFNITLANYSHPEANVSVALQANNIIVSNLTSTDSAILSFIPQTADYNLTFIALDLLDSDNATFFSQLQVTVPIATANVGFVPQEGSSGTNSQGPGNINKTIIVTAAAVVSAVALVLVSASRSFTPSPLKKIEGSLLNATKVIAVLQQQFYTQEQNSQRNFWEYLTPKMNNYKDSLNSIKELEKNIRVSIARVQNEAAQRLAEERNKNKAQDYYNILLKNPRLTESQRSEYVRRFFQNNPDVGANFPGAQDLLTLATPPPVLPPSAYWSANRAVEEGKALKEKYNIPAEVSLGSGNLKDIIAKYRVRPVEMGQNLNAKDYANETTWQKVTGFLGGAAKFIDMDLGRKISTAGYVISDLFNGNFSGAWDTTKQYYSKEWNSFTNTVKTNWQTIAGAALVGAGIGLAAVTVGLSTPVSVVLISAGIGFMAKRAMDDYSPVLNELNNTTDKVKQEELYWQTKGLVTTDVLSAIAATFGGYAGLRLCTSAKPTMGITKSQKISITEFEDAKFNFDFYLKQYIDKYFDSGEIKNIKFVKLDTGNVMSISKEGILEININQINRIKINPDYYFKHESQELKLHPLPKGTEAELDNLKMSQESKNYLWDSLNHDAADIPTVRNDPVAAKQWMVEHSDDIMDFVKYNEKYKLDIRYMKEIDAEQIIIQLAKNYAILKESNPELASKIANAVPDDQVSLFTQIVRLFEGVVE